MNILHLSDIHFGRNYPEYGLNDPFDHHDKIIDGIIDVIASMDDALKPEHIIFTGDIVWHGKRKEYKEALVWFRRLLDACQLTGKDISFCVGNHDIDLSYQFDDIHYDADMVEEIDELYRYENLHVLDDCLNAYNEFCREIGTLPYTYPSKGKRNYSYSMGYKDVPFSDGKTIRIVAMNTAMLMTQNVTDDKMWLGREQLKSLIHYGILPGGDDIWYTVGLFHHSDRFLHPNETSTYDGRSATLPSLMGYTNLLACGHTESSGRPRLSKQPGGGTMLLGGAAYYNDRHINSFSMIYISETKKSMGYIPYIYDGEWMDYDFCNPEYKLAKTHVLEDAGQIYDHIDFVLERAEENYVIPFEYLEWKDHGQSIRSDMDFMNHFHLRYNENESDEVVISCAKGKEKYIETLCCYQKFVDFITQSTCDHINCYLKNQEGIKIKEFGGMTYQRIPEFDPVFINDILSIESHFDVRFTIPDTVSRKDYDKIAILKSIAKDGFTDKVKVLESFHLKKTKEEMNKLYEAGLQENRFGVYGEDFFSIRLFNVNVMLGKVLLFAGPFNLDLDDTKFKLETYQKFDERYCNFQRDKDVKAYIIQDRKRASEYGELPSFTLLDNHGEIGFSLDL